MNYRTNIKNGDKISELAYGCMRFPKDDAELERQIAYAIDNGVNYFDTAYVYPNSEKRLGLVLSKGYREKVKIATKLPPYFVNKREDCERIFAKQLSRLKTDFVDYYMLHMLTELKSWERLCDTDIGITEWLEEKKASGAIKNIGFSYHGGKAEFERIIDAYDWDFCMIQYNYLDEFKQAGKSGLLYAAGKGLPVMIMEPLRGGMLAGRLPKDAVEVIKNAYVKRSPAEWGLKWVLNHPQALTVLSGMGTMQMLEENIRIASETQKNSLTEKDFEVYGQITAAINANMFVGCTGCNYCMPCPAGVDIPLCFSCFNEIGISGRLKSKMDYILRADKHNASLCNFCGRCEKTCPQKLEVRKELRAVQEAMEGVMYKPLRFLARKFMKLN